MLNTSLDRTSATDHQTLAEVEQVIASGGRALRFSGDLEQRYEAETLEQRRQSLTTVGIGGLLVYNLFLISDWLTLNDVFTYLVLGRLCLITPMFIVLLLWIQRVNRRWTLEAITAAGPVLASLMPMVVMIYSYSPYRLHYQLGMLLLMVYCSMIQQLPLRYAAVAMSLMLIIQLVTTYIADFSDFLIWQANFLLFASAVALLLMASWFLERGSRLSYLFALRGRLLQAQLMELARTDALTQLFNRHYQEEVLTSVWEYASHTPTSVAVILLDIDNFKAYNDNYGHPQGDTCLKLLSSAIKQAAQKRDALTFRFGGEEILVLMMNADVSKARHLAEDLRDVVAALNVPHPILGEGARVTISLGLAAAIAPQSDAGALIGAADAALYSAKHAGRDCIRCADVSSERSSTVETIGFGNSKNAISQSR
ncbi:GGDEF domain-containing protein [Pseudomonas trivialis]|uniref:diguanylate cyclase n=1 Tax=Pseudomonas trivialis TaxID=200450 RepID=A0ABY0ULT7_9PSED|nr:GGDEF domain-containing protein [Pseudomonas trivialis]SDS87892.1 diguanylate cyclase (GGDEF) domain-containing protein [Pseudomonas trivialis]